MKTYQAWLKDESQTRQCAQWLADAYADWLLATPQAELAALSVSLNGDLGAGKSTFARALVQRFLPEQKVKSPTFTLVETYPVELSGAQGDPVSSQIVHFDCYRLGDPEELEFLGVRDLLKAPSLALVEWPQKGEGVLPSPDLICRLTVADPVQPEAGRHLAVEARTEAGRRLLAGLALKNPGMKT
ncbi:MAG: tRNA (adenosine(37)-N6)-threonylcarbamoyltransferase complex ATPase subunit type 1 TsaE [Hydrogenovibrio sp.]|uniref:tRNA (adenosine(37)-N6)-threonylcarbamoyltransferase complex ATPase subunit type 1 TsaE n=1 Tax=Hydrogenovibrio sp. TaxID=2065821 RepID=UPI0028706048|nr:tRNA (adenosine(37)-N6)-threonylcarbamoyltransferase complex ATPase subunit type 1 TsaE [Hydrogenovibrio sp.]MDR9497548.1 tRNA (adenosine(37)-N6)-threonylcarbamoyltransferase complex ATPase subunit type 1 TsaE [Hydrogenovibrio sp.]